MEIQDITAIAATSPEAGDKITVTRGQLVAMLDALTHLLSQDERAALVRYEGGDPLSETNHLVDEADLQAVFDELGGITDTLRPFASAFYPHINNAVVDVKHITDAVLAALATRGTGAALSAANPIIAADQLAMAISTAAENYATAAQGALASTAIQPAELAAETAARIEADQEMLGNRQLVWCRDFHSGHAYLQASAARAARGLYGFTDLYRILVAGTGIGVLVDAAPLKVELTDPLDNASRFKVSIELDSGTLVLQTIARAMPHAAWRAAGISVDSPVSGSISSALVHVWVGGAEYTIENEGLEVVGTSYTGAPVAGTGAWTLCADSAGANTLTCRVASDGWHALNYPLTSAQWTDWLATGRLPYEGAGSMQTATSATASGDSTSSATGMSGAGLVSQSAIAHTGNAIQITSTANTYTGLYLYEPLKKESRYVISAWFYIPSGQAHTPNLITPYLFTSAGTIAGTISGTVVTDEWFELKREITTSGVCNGFQIYWGAGSIAGVVMYVDDVRVVAIGDVLAGLDLSAQPVCSRTAAGAVLLDSTSGVELSPYARPERMTLATQVPMTADGYLLGDRMVHPAGYAVDKILVTNSGSASATVTIRAASSGGTVIATGTVAATGKPVALAVSAPGELTAAGGKIYVGGASASSLISPLIKLAKN